MMKELYSIGLIPVIKIENPDDAVPLAKALIDGGLPAAEITFRTACAAEAIKNITEAYPEMLVGAGTVLTIEQVDAAIAAGSKFIVSPGLNPKVTSYCLSKGVPMLQAVLTPLILRLLSSLVLRLLSSSPLKLQAVSRCSRLWLLPTVSLPSCPQAVSTLTTFSITSSLTR